MNELVNQVHQCHFTVVSEMPSLWSWKKSHCVKKWKVSLFSQGAAFPDLSFCSLIDLCHLESKPNHMRGRPQLSPAQQMKAAELLPVQKLTKRCTRTSYMLDHLVCKTLYLAAYLTNQRSDPDPATVALPLLKRNKLQVYKLPLLKKTKDHL